MTYSRAALVAVQSIAYQLASTPPNKTPPKARFDANHPWYIRIAPTVMKIQQPLIWLCSFVELSISLAEPLSTLLHLPLPSLAPKILHSIPVYSTRATTIGTFLVVFGSLIRLICFRTLGQLFTFDLTILPKHILVTCGPYAYVRHPAYTGSLSMIVGLALVNLTPGSWLAEAGILGCGQLGVVLRALGGVAWWLWWLAVGVKRCRAEDAELRKTFGKEWEDYAEKVRYWFVPGLL